MEEVKKIEAKINPKYGALPAGSTREPGVLNVTAIPIRKNNKYETGLDEFSVVVRSISDTKLRAEKIAELNKKRAELEVKLGRSLDQTTPEGRETFEEMEIDFNNLPISRQDPYDELVLTILEANTAYSDFPIATNKDSLSGTNTYKEYYLENSTKELETKVSREQKRDRMSAIFLDLFDNNESKLRDIAILMLPPSVNILKTTPKTYVYNAIKEYLYDGIATSNYTSIEAVYAALKEIVALTDAELDMRVTVTKALRLNILTKNTSGVYTNRAASSIVGRELEELYDYYRNIENQAELGLGKKNDTVFSLKAQITNRESS